MCHSFFCLNNANNTYFNMESTRCLTHYVGTSRYVPRLSLTKLVVFAGYGLVRSATYFIHSQWGLNLASKKEQNTIECYWNQFCVTSIWWDNYAILLEQTITNRTRHVASKLYASRFVYVTCFTSVSCKLTEHDITVYGVHHPNSMWPNWIYLLNYHLI